MQQPKTKLLRQMPTPMPPMPAATESKSQSRKRGGASSFRGTRSEEGWFMAEKKVKVADYRL
jgi:hypothetical protein